MIPKIINYCWFGGKPLPNDALKCIESWKKFCPDYEIKQWNEENFDIECCNYVKEAYREKKWAFVSDYARFKILYENGGLYFDTDVELIRSIDDIIKKGPFMGCEYTQYDHIKTNAHICKSSINPGLGLGAEPFFDIYKIILEKYEKRNFINSDGSLDQTTVVEFVTNILKEYGYKQNNTLQVIAGIYIYPIEFFCPMNYVTGQLIITENTRSIHHYTASWLTEKSIKWNRFKRYIYTKFGQHRGQFIFETVIMKLIKNLYIKGIRYTIKIIIEKGNKKLHTLF